MKLTRSGNFITAVCALSIALSGCTKSTPENPMTVGLKPPPPTVGENAKPAPGDKPDAQEEDHMVRVEQELPQVGEAEKHIDLAHMPDTLTILTVNGSPITVGEYRRQYAVRAEQFRTQLAVNANLRQSALMQAQSAKITLSEQEKKEISARLDKMRKATGTVMAKFLADSKMTDKEYQQMVMDLGLAQKASLLNLQHVLLGEMVDRDLLTAAARADGLGPEANNKFLEAKKTANYKGLEGSGLLGPEELKQEFIDAQLMTLMIDKIEKAGAVTDAQVKALYDKDKSQFKHGARVRLSQIFIAAPKVDGPAGESIETQLKKQNPKITPSQLDTQTKMVDDEKKKRAQALLDRALKGEDFAKLANENTDDIPVKAAKLGGDMGFQDKERLLKNFASKINSLKPGQVCPTLIVSQMGYHVMKMVEVQPEGLLSFKDVAPMLRQIMTQNASVQAVSDWLYKHRKDAKVVLSPDFEKAVAALPPSAKSETSTANASAATGAAKPSAGAKPAGAGNASVSTKSTH